MYVRKYIRQSRKSTTAGAFGFRDMKPPRTVKTQERQDREERMPELRQTEE
jgi:hypothetical protein